MMKYKFYFVCSANILMIKTTGDINFNLTLIKIISLVV
jgi:hypothetical protein